MNSVTVKKLTVFLPVFFFVLLSLWWLSIHLGFLSDETPWYDLFSDFYGIMALVGGIIGLTIAKKWGGGKSLIGKAILGFSLGLLFQAFGQVMYSYYYYVQGIENPYPSIGDIGYYSTIPAYVYAIWNLGKASGMDFGMGKKSSYAIAILIPLTMLVITYRIFLSGYEFDWENPLIIFLDFVNPLGQAVIISMTIITYIITKNLLGGIMKNKVLLLLTALVLQYTADFVFLYSTNREIWAAGGISEYLYLLAYFVMALGISSLNFVFDRIRNN